MSDDHGADEARVGPEFNEVPTGKYEVDENQLRFGARRPDGSMADIPPVHRRDYMAQVVAELERARLDSSAECFKTLQLVVRQRDALQTVYEMEQETNRRWAKLMEAERLDMDRYRDQAHDLAKKLEEANLAFEASEMMRQTLGEEIDRLKGIKESAEAVPYGYAIHKDIGGWYFTEPNPASDTIRMRWATMDEAQLDAWNHAWKVMCASIDPATQRQWSLNPIERKVVEEVRSYLDGWPDTSPVSIKANQNDGFFSIHIEKKDPRGWTQNKPGSASKHRPLRDQFWRVGPFSATVRARVSIPCCHILPGDTFEVYKDLADGKNRLVGTPFKIGAPHFFEWDDVDLQLEMIEETTPALKA